MFFNQFRETLRGKKCFLRKNIHLSDDRTLEGGTEMIATGNMDFNIHEKSGMIMVRIGILTAEMAQAGATDIWVDVHDVAMA